MGAVFFLFCIYILILDKNHTGDILETMKEFIEIVQTVGFPILIALLLYIDLRKVIKSNTRAIQELNQIIIRKLK